MDKKDLNKREKSSSTQEKIVVPVQQMRENDKKETIDRPVSKDEFNEAVVEINPSPDSMNSRG